MRNGRGKAVRRKSRKTTDGGKAPRRCSREVYWLGLRTSQVQNEGKRVVGEWVAPIPLCQEKKKLHKMLSQFWGLKKKFESIQIAFSAFFWKKKSPRKEPSLGTGGWSDPPSHSPHPCKKNRFSISTLSTLQSKEKPYERWANPPTL